MSTKHDTPLLPDSLRSTLERWNDGPEHPLDLRQLLVGLAKLARPHLAPELYTGISTAELYSEGVAGPSDLMEARRDVWAFVTGLACGVGPRDGRAAEIVMACLEPASTERRLPRLLEQVERVVSLGVPGPEVAAWLAETLVAGGAPSASQS